MWLASKSRLPVEGQTATSRASYPVAPAHAAISGRASSGRQAVRKPSFTSADLDPGTGAGGLQHGVGDPRGARGVRERRVERFGRHTLARMAAHGVVDVGDERGEAV